MNQSIKLYVVKEQNGKQSGQPLCFAFYFTLFILATGILFLAII